MSRNLKLFPTNLLHTSSVHIFCYFSAHFQKRYTIPASNPCCWPLCLHLHTVGLHFFPVPLKLSLDWST